MAVAGCDIGSLTAKAVILDDGKIISQTVIRANPASVTFIDLNGSLPWISNPARCGPEGWRR
jgi:hypothetical protein